MLMPEPPLFPSKPEPSVPPMRSTLRRVEDSRPTRSKDSSLLLPQAQKLRPQMMPKRLLKMQRLRRQAPRMLKRRPKAPTPLRKRQKKNKH